MDVRSRHALSMAGSIGKSDDTPASLHRRGS